MSNQRSVGRFCSVVVTHLSGASDSIASLVGSTLGEGAEAWCVDQASTYRYTTATIAADAFFFVAASGGGTWVLQAGAAGTPFGSGLFGTVAFQGGALVSASQNVWTALPTGAFWFAEILNGNYWTLNTTTGVRTYTGPSREFTCNAAISVSAASAQGIEFDLTENGSRIGGTVNGSIISQIGQAGSGAFTVIAQTCSFFATNGSTYQHIFRTNSTPSPTNVAFGRFASVFAAL